jgi:hypothetical protein
LRRRWGWSFRREILQVACGFQPRTCTCSVAIAETIRLQEFIATVASLNINIERDVCEKTVNFVSYKSTGSGKRVACRCEMLAGGLSVRSCKRVESVGIACRENNGIEACGLTG